MRMVPKATSSGVASISLVASLIGLLLAIRDSSQLSNNGPGNASCGTTDDLALKVEVCSKPTLDLIQGTLEVWPKTLNDTANLCELMRKSEKCIRDENRRCAHGLHKTILSALSSSVQRSWKRECGRDKYPGILRLVNCVERHTNEIGKLATSVEDKLRIVELEMKDPTEKMNAICCSMKSLETDMTNLFDRICPANTQTIVRFYKIVVEDVSTLICRTAKCQGDLFRKYRVPKSSANQGKLIASVLRIVFDFDK